MPNQDNQELFIKATIMERQSRELEQNLQIIDQQLQELSKFSDSLKNLESANDDKEKEIFASLGKGVYSKAQIQEKELLVNVGAGVFVKKSPKETLLAIGLQLSKLQEARLHISAQLEAYTQNFKELLSEFNKHD